MDDEQRAEFERAYREKIEREQLEAARANLNQEQLAHLEWYAARLREAETYAPKYETEIAKIIRVDDYVHYQRAQIKEVYTRAENDARDRDTKEQLIAKARALKEAEQQREQQGQLELSDQQRQREAEVIARQQRDFESMQFIRNAAGIDRQHQQNDRYQKALENLKHEPQRPQQDAAHPLLADWRAAAHEVLDRKLPPRPSSDPTPEPPPYQPSPHDPVQSALQKPDYQLTDARSKPRDWWSNASDILSGKVERVDQAQDNQQQRARETEPSRQAASQNSTYDYSGTRTKDADWWKNAREIVDRKAERSDRAQGERQQERENQKNPDGTQKRQTLNRGGFSR